MPRPTTKTVKRLFAVSGNRCAFPGCPSPLVIEGTVTAEICHIKAQSAGGPRYDPNQTNLERHGFENLLLLCGDHHKVIDADSTTYTVEKLVDIKQEHEAKYADGTEPSDEVAQQFVTQLHIGDVVHGDKVLGDKVVYVQPPQPPLPPYDPLPPPDPDELPDPSTLPPGSRLPFARNALFTGREEPLKALARALLHTKGPATLITQAVQGMGGMGKTQIAIEFAYRYGRFFHGVHWINAARAESIGAEMAACGQAMHLPYWPAEQPEQVELTLREWQRDGSRLVILDNLEDVGVVRELLIRLSGGLVRVLVTTRRSDWPADLGLDPLRLDVFAPDESRVFLRRYLPERRASGDDVDALAERLGYLPLALELAGRYLAGYPRLSISVYLERLDDVWSDPSMAHWREDMGSPTGHDLGLAATFAMSWEQVTDEAARRVFLVAGWCAPNAPIPCKLLEQTAGLRMETCDEAAGALASLGLLGMEDAKVGPTIHPLLAEYARRQKEATGVQFSLINTLAQMVGAAWEQIEETGNPAHFAPLVPHVWAVAPIAEEEGVENAGSLWYTLGRYLNEVADYSRAQAAYERALAICEAAYGPDHPQTAANLNNLGLVLHNLGKYTEAREVFERALAVKEKVHGPNHPDVTLSLGNLGMVLHDLRDYAGAQAAYEQDLAVCEAAYGPDHPRVAASLNSLGLVLHDLEDYDGARAALTRSLMIRESISGPDHPDTAMSLGNLGLVLHAWEDYAGARAAYEQALAISQTVYGLDHPQTAANLSNLGLVLHDLGLCIEAREVHRRALAIRETIYGPEHPRVAMSVGNLGLVLHDLGDYAGARAALARALAIAEKSLPPAHPDIKQHQRNYRATKWPFALFYIAQPIIFGLSAGWTVINTKDWTKALPYAAYAVVLVVLGTTRRIWVPKYLQARAKFRQIRFRWRNWRKERRHLRKSKEEQRAND